QERREPELIGIVPGTKNRPTVWERLARPIPALTGNTPLGQYILTGSGSASPDSQLSSVAHFRDALGVLASQPTAELERLLGETLEVCSYRLDSWGTSLARKPRTRMRTS